MTPHPETHRVINTALASYGMSGQLFHAPSLLWHSGFAVRKVYERSKSLSAQRLPDATIVRRFSAILEDPDIELVVVNTPNALHFDMARAALEHGKHVVLEKPITINVADGERLLAVARDHGVVLAPYQNRRLESGYKTVRDVLAQQLLGDIKLFETRIDRWRPGLGTKQWKETANSGAGLLYDLGAHLVDEVLSLFGWPHALYADIRTQRSASVVDDYFHLILEFGEIKAELKAGFIAREPGPWYVVHGTHGSYVKTAPDPQQALLADGILPETTHWRAEHESEWGVIHDDSGRRPYPSLPGAYHEFYDNLYNVLTGGADLLIAPREALDVIRIIELAQKSNAEKCRLTLDM